MEGCDFEMTWIKDHLAWIIIDIILLSLTISLFFFGFFIGGIILGIITAILLVYQFTPSWRA